MPSFLSNKLPSRMDMSILTVFTVSVMYWVYLAFHSNMLIRYDSLGYEQLASVIYKNGWSEYFRTGPNREPLYPWIISLSLRWADYWGISYHVIQKSIQIFILLITQIFTFRILKRLNIPTPLTALTLLYLGLSPSIVNSAFSIYSEIATYPPVLGIILLSTWAWESIQRNDRPKILLAALGIGVLFVLAIFVKFIFQYIFFLFLVPFIALLLKALLSKDEKIASGDNLNDFPSQPSFKYLGKVGTAPAAPKSFEGKRGPSFRKLYNFLKDKKLFINSSSFLLIVILVTNGFVIPYKSLNKKFNGVYAFTDRAAWALYGNTARNLQPLNGQRILAAFAFVAGEGVCRRFAPEKECVFWSYRASDDFGYTKLWELQRTIPKETIDPTLIHLSKNLVLTNPIQYFFITSLMSFKLFFWESTKLSYVDYPPWLNKLYNCGPFKDGLRFLVFLITILSFFGVIRLQVKNKQRLTEIQFQREHTTVFFILVLISSYIIMHAFFFVLTRYALPIVPLFLIIIAYFLKSIIPQRKNENQENRLRR